jgi:hypothetical protein
MADRIVTDLSDDRLRSGIGPVATGEFLQMLSVDMNMFMDDFMDSTNADMDNRYTRACTGGGAAGVVLTLEANQEWGSAKMTTGAGNDQISAMSLGTICKGDNNAVMAVRYKINTAALSKIEIGFRDSVANNTAGIVNVLNTPSFNGSSPSGCCWVYDTDATVATWKAAGVNAGTAATTIGLTASSPHTSASNNGALPIDDVYQTMVVAMLEDNAYFSRYNVDGKKQGATLMVSGSQLGSTLLAPSVFVQSRSTSTRVLDIDFFKMWQLRRS